MERHERLANAKYTVRLFLGSDPYRKATIRIRKPVKYQLVDG